MSPGISTKKGIATELGGSRESCQVTDSRADHSSPLFSQA